MAFSAPNDITLDVESLHSFSHRSASVFDYDITFIHVTLQHYNNRSQYFYALPKLRTDVKIALEHGRTLICMAEAHDFQSEGSKGERGELAYRWLEELGVKLQDSNGENIKPTGGDHAGYHRVYRGLLSTATPTVQTWFFVTGGI